VPLALSRRLTDAGDGPAAHYSEHCVVLARSIFALLAIALGAGCGRSSHAATRGRGGRDTAAARVATSTARTVVVTAHDYSFTGVPARIRSGWITFRLVNAGAEVHMMGFERVPSGHSARAVLDATAANRPSPETAAWGGPNAVSPGDTSTVTMFFPPGEYAIGCAVESEDGRMHAVKGMMSVMTVVGPPDSSVAPPTADATVTLTSYHVAVHGALAPGVRTLFVENGASQGHDLEILEILPGHTEADALRWFAHPAKEAPPARAVGGVVAIHPGQRAFVSATLRRGSYVFLCWVPDDAGQPHFQRGMHQLITIGNGAGGEPWKRTAHHRSVR
jgi:hypothetical protein